MGRLGKTATVALVTALCALTLRVLAQMLDARANPAGAQALMCAPKAKMTAYLKDTYNEEPVGGGILTSGRPMLILAAPAGKSFTQLVLLPDGQACLMATGKGFAVAPPPLPGKDM